MAKTVTIGSHLLGEGQPTFVVAEMSGNHGGSLEKALQLVHHAKSLGADAIKLQTYTADTITIKCDKEDFRLAPDSQWGKFQSLWDLYNHAHTPWEWHAPIFAEAKSIGLTAFSSVFDTSALTLLESLKAPAYKIASPEITNIPLLRSVARTGKPIILSTGLAELLDIELAVSTLRKSGATEIIILKCTTAYPTPPEEVNLRTISDIRTRFSVLSGLSDHTQGIAAALGAVAMGASLIEKHFMLDDEERTVDSFFSAAGDEFSVMVKGIRFLERALGTVSYQLTPSAVPNVKGRSSLYVSRPIKAGELFSPENIIAVRPGYGLHPRHYEEILGRAASRDLEIGDRLSWEVVC